MSAFGKNRGVADRDLCQMHPDSFTNLPLHKLITPKPIRGLNFFRGMEHASEFSKMVNTPPNNLMIFNKPIKFSINFLNNNMRRNRIKNKINKFINLKKITIIIYLPQNPIQVFLLNCIFFDFLQKILLILITSNFG